ncbi:MAG TPA: FkbM family methyltransferase [Micromonosporaceae bacterium]|nr:FkbM family methyltransferase [Micromonosporaceae bacterium]
MNLIERIVDNTDPSISVRLRAVKKWWHRDQVGRVLAALTATGTVAVDVGANRGVYTYVLSTKVGRTGQVHAVEPYPGNAARLQTLARRRGNITFHPVALSDTVGQAALRVPVHEGKHIDALATLGPVVGAGHDDIPIPVRTLDDLLGDESGRISVLKCDVEGHEDRVLRGGAAVLRRHMPAIIVEVEQRHRSDRIEDTFAYLLGLGYVGYFLVPHGLRPLAEFDAAQHQPPASAAQFVAYSMPDGYVTDFLFVRSGTSLGALVTPQRRRVANPVRLPRPRQESNREAPTTPVVGRNWTDGR